MNETLIFSIIFALVWSDLFNYIFSDGALAAWKQMIIVVMWIAAIRYDLRSGVFYRSVTTAFVVMILIFWSILFCQIDPIIAIFNSFLYFSWVPAYVVFLHNVNLRSIERYSSIALTIFVLSVAGLYIDWYTDLFNWIERQVQSVYLLESIGAARRASFFFISSTMVIPLLTAPAIVYLLGRRTTLGLILVAAGVLLSILPTGSGSTMIVATIFVAGLLIDNKKLALKVSAAALLISAFIAPILLTVVESDNRLGLQVDRLSMVFNSETESNVARRDFWYIAIIDIERMSPLEMLLGAGLGTTNDNKGNRAIFTHGESSFLQAMIEAGFIGILGRLLPFLLIFLFLYKAIRLRNRSGGNSQFILLFWTISSLLAITTAPTFGNIPFQVILGFVLATAVKFQTQFDESRS